MPTSTARVTTAQADRYLQQLCRHAEAVSRRPGQRLHDHLDRADTHPQIQRVESSSAHATLHFDRGRCLVATEPATLTLRVEADDPEILRQIQTLIAADIERFGTRERLTVTWHSDGHDDMDGSQSQTATAVHAVTDHGLPGPIIR